MSATTVFERRPRLVSRQVRGSVIVVGPDRAHRRLDGAAAAVWESLDEPGSSSELAIRMAALGDGTDPIDPALIDLALQLLVDAGVVWLPSVGDPEADQ